MKKLLHLASARSVFATCGLLAATTPASAVVVGSFVHNGDGTVTYSYQVDNSTGAFDVAQWSLEFSFLTPDWNQLDSFSGGEVEVPNPTWFADAGTPISGLSAQDFLSLNPSGDVLTGTSLGTFSFTSNLLPGVIAFYEFSATGDFRTGTTIGPANVRHVPEGGVGIEGIALAALTLCAFGTRSTRSPA